MQHSIGQKAVAEFVGTFTLIFIAAGSIIVAGQAGGGAGLITIGLAHGLAFGVMVSALGHVSGAHLNPAVTFGALITRKISPANAAVYLIAELAGASAGALVLRAAIPSALWEPVRLGTPIPTKTFDVSGVQIPFSSIRAVLVEMVLTFFLVWVVFATAIDPDGAFGKIAGLAIGLTITMGVFAGAPLTGAAMNPARTFGPALVGGYWTDHWVYWVGPLVGGGLAALAYDLIILRPRLRAVAAEVTRPRSSGRRRR